MNGKRASPHQASLTARWIYTSQFVTGQGELEYVSNYQVPQ